LAALASAAPAPKAKPAEYGIPEYISVSDVVQAANIIKDIFMKVEAKIQSGVEGDVKEFLQGILDMIELYVNAVKPMIQIPLLDLKAEVEDLLLDVEVGIEHSKPILQELLDRILAKIAELKDRLIGGYGIFDNLIPTVQKHMEDLLDKLARKKNELVEYVTWEALVNFIKIGQIIEEIFDQLKEKIALGKVKANIVDFFETLKNIVEGKIAEAKPIVKEALEKVRAAVEDFIAKAKENGEASIAQGKGLLNQLLEKIMTRLAELKGKIAGYNIFDDLLNDVLKPAIKHAIENVIPVISKHLGDLIDKIKPVEYQGYLNDVLIPALGEAIMHDLPIIGKRDYLADLLEWYSLIIADIVNKLKAKIVSGEVKANIVDFLEKLRSIVEAKIVGAKPAIKAVLEKVKAAVDEMVTKAKVNAEAGIEQGKGILVQLLQKIMAKLAELKDSVSGYGIFDDLLNDVLKPALGKAIENLIPTIQKHLGDLIGKLLPNEYVEYLAMNDIIEVAHHIKDIFNQLKAKIASGEVKGNIVDFLEKLKSVIKAKVAGAKPIVQEALEKVNTAVEEVIAKAKENAEAGIAQGKGLLVQLLEKIMAKLAELKNEISGYNIFDDLLHDVLKPALKNAIENLIPTISKHLGDLVDKLQPTEYQSYLVDLLEWDSLIMKEIFKRLKAKIASGELKANIVDFLEDLKSVIKSKIAGAKPAIKAALERVKAAIDEMIAKAKANAEAGNEQGKDILGQLLKKIMVIKPSGYVEYLTISEVLEAAADLKDIFNQIKAKIESGEIKDSIVDFLNKIKAAVDAKITAATPAVKAILEKVDAAVQDVIANAKAGIESGKGLLADLLETIINKISELKENIGGYNIFGDLLNDVLKPALKQAIENLIPTIAKHLGDLADKLKPTL